MDCSCIAPDGNCNASVSCPEKCYAVCPPLPYDHCIAGCSAEEVKEVVNQFPADGLISYSFKAMTVDEISRIFSRALGAKIIVHAGGDVKLDAFTAHGIKFGKALSRLAETGGARLEF